MPRELEAVCTLEGHNWTVSSVSFHPAAHLLASGGFDRTIRIWDVADSSSARSTAISSAIATKDAGGSVATCLRVIDRSAHAGPITCVRWHPNGALIASTSADNTTCLWDASTGERMRILREHFGWVLQCSFAPDRTKLATASWDKTVRLWDPNTGELISTLRGHTKGVWACEFYPVGHTSALLATGGEDCTARLWDTRTRKVALTLSGGHADAVYSVAWSNDGSLVATGSADRTVTIWDPKAGKILRLLKAHEDTVKSAVFCPINTHNASNILATAGGFSAILWNPGLPSNNLLSESRMHSDGKEVESVSVSYDGRLMATGGRDGAVCVCRVPAYRNDIFEGIDPGARHQTKAAESWLRGGRNASVTVPKIQSSNIRDEIAQQSVRLAMEDESNIWLRRNVRQEEAEQPQQEVTPRRVNPSKLLESRGFNRDGFSKSAFDESEDVETERPATPPAPIEEEPLPEPEDEVEESQTKHFVPLKKTTMLDDKGKVHPMVAAARKNAPPQQELSRKPTNKADNVDALMDMLREKTEESVQLRQTKRSSVVRPPSSVEELLDLSKPVLERKPRVPTASALYPKQGKDEQTSF
eukprot:m.40904 g.40904  ORF g.40904 m.40904 type:complete len:588 (-) comp11761_c0_seq1:753-2516(-)